MCEEKGMGEVTWSAATGEFDEYDTLWICGQSGRHNGTTPGRTAASALYRTVQSKFNTHWETHFTLPVLGSASLEASACGYVCGSWSYVQELFVDCATLPHHVCCRVAAA